MQSWQQLRAARDTLSGGAHEEKRAALETRMMGLVKTLGADPDLGAVRSLALARNGRDNGRRAAGVATLVRN